MITCRGANYVYQQKIMKVLQDDDLDRSSKKILFATN
jgi:hypothetical protein